MESSPATESEALARDGYVIVPALLDAEELGLVQRLAAREVAGVGAEGERRDASGAATKLAIRNELRENDLFSALARSARIVRRMERLLGGEVYHYHHKLMVKEARGGGAWEWHQDYGYWYGNGCLFPWMGSCLIAISDQTRDNGCLQVIRGSHAAGRMEHGPVGDQTGAEPGRVAELAARLPVVHCEMPAGAALFFHCNLLHRSDRNASDAERLSLICCYNSARNDPYKEHHHPRYTPLHVLDDAAVVRVGRAQLA